MFSEFNFSCFEKRNPLSNNVPAMFHDFYFSCDSCRYQTSSKAVEGNRGIENGVVH